MKWLFLSLVYSQNAWRNFLTVFVDSRHVGRWISRELGSSTEGFQKFYKLTLQMPILVYIINLSHHGHVKTIGCISSSEDVIYQRNSLTKNFKLTDIHVILLTRKKFFASMYLINMFEYWKVSLQYVVNRLLPANLFSPLLCR